MEAAAHGGAAATRRGVATGSGQNGIFRQWGGHLAGSPLGGLPRPTALTTHYLAFPFYLSWPTGTTNPYHLPPILMYPPQPLTCTTRITCTTPGAKCLKKFVGQKRNALRRLICGIWTRPKLGGATHWQKSLALLERVLYAPTAPLFGIVPSTHSQPLPEWQVW
nr:MAG TPA: hypothetical protein [Caudoviricetes sp.]